MSEFKALFGIKSSEIKKRCLLLPCLNKAIFNDFNAQKFIRGKLYGCANTANFTFIHTGIGPGLTGDAVLRLKNTPCREVFLLGSCGLTGAKRKLAIGDLVAPSRSYASESFSELLTRKELGSMAYFPDKENYRGLLEAGKGRVKEAVCLTISSLKLEEELLPLLVKKDIDILDMESSAFFAAAEYCRLKGLALFYISDIIGKKPFYAKRSPALQLRLSSAIKNAVNLVCDFIEMNTGALDP